MRERPFYVLTALLAAVTTALLVAVAAMHLPIAQLSFRQDVASTAPVAPLAMPASIAPAPRVAQDASSEDMPPGAQIARARPRTGDAQPSLDAQPAAERIAPKAEPTTPEPTTPEASDAAPLASSPPSPTAAPIGGPLVAPAVAPVAPDPGEAAAAAAVAEQPTPAQSEPASEEARRAAIEEAPNLGTRAEPPDPRVPHAKKGARARIAMSGRAARRAKNWDRKRASNAPVLRRRASGRPVRVWRAPPPVPMRHLPPGSVIILVEPVR